jgi:hypothetical protein
MAFTGLAGALTGCTDPKLGEWWKVEGKYAPVWKHGWNLIWAIGMRRDGSTVSIFAIRSAMSRGTNPGMLYSPRRTRSNRVPRFSSSNGREPVISANRITPILHTSVRVPSYAPPSMISGEA